MITKEELLEVLNEIVPSYEDHITTKEPMKLPYIVLLQMGSENMFADNKTHFEITPYSFILHEAKRNEELENSIKEVLNDNSIPYELQSPEWDSTHKLYALTFDIRI